MAPPRPSKPAQRRAHQSHHAPSSFTSSVITTLEPLLPVHYIILDHLLHVAPHKYIRLSKDHHAHGIAHLSSSPVDFDERTVSRFHESVQKQQDTAWLYPITQSSTIRFRDYSTFAKMVCLLSQVSRQKRRKRRPGANYPAQYHPPRLFGQASRIEITIDQTVSMFSLFKQMNTQLGLTNPEYGLMDTGSQLKPGFEGAILLHITNGALSTLGRCSTEQEGAHLVSDISGCFLDASRNFSVIAKLSISSSSFPNPNTFSTSLLSLLSSFCRRRSSIVMLGISGPTITSLRQSAAKAIVEYIEFDVSDSRDWYLANSMTFRMPMGEDVGQTVWKELEKTICEHMIEGLKEIYYFEDWEGKPEEEAGDLKAESSSSS
ncbi:hypothetical protein IAR50_005290 [Cryptococcus sp. DSM 104548]